MTSSQLRENAMPKGAARRPTWLWLAFALTFGLLLNPIGSPALAAEIVVRHASGQTTLSKRPEKVLVYDLPALDILDVLGVPVAGVPRGVKPAHLRKYDDPRYPKVGTLFEPDYEAVNAAAPDLVIVGGRSGPKYAALSKIAPTINITGDATDPVGSLTRNVEMLAGLFGKAEEGQACLASLRGELERLRQKAAGAGTALIVLTAGGKVTAYGPGSRFGVIHDAIGLEAAAPDLKVAVHGQPVSFEYIAKVNPDWLLVVDRDAAVAVKGQPARELLDNDLVRQTKAWSTGRVVYLDSALLYLAGGGLSAMKTTLDQVGTALEAAR